MRLYYKFIGAPNLYHDYQPESQLSVINTILYKQSKTSVDAMLGA